jgi:hypothetical protein
MAQTAQSPASDERLAILPVGGVVRSTPAEDCTLSPDAEHRVGIKVFSLTPEASLIEEPGAVVPHAGIGAGGAG